ncbi:MAG: metal ABC transporter solute-binding protein, Zn/Mn family [Calditrichia bacterium]
MKLIGFGLILLLMLSCGKQQEQNAQEIGKRQLKVVATTGMIGDILINLGGNRLEVTSLMGPGIDPHLYKASEGDVTRLSSADIIFYNGLHLEGKMAEVLEKLESRIKTVAVAKGIPQDLLRSSEAFQGNNDPHIWFDVSLWMKAVDYVSRQLKEFDPEHAEVYEANHLRYRERLEKLNERITKILQTVPEDQRVLVTAHDAFGYFGDAYGFEVRGLQGISTASETGAADVQNLAKFIVERKIPAIFVETSVPPRYIEALQAAVRSRGHEVVVGGSLFSDAMGNPGTAEGTYLGMVKHNVNTIVRALVQKRLAS